MALDERDYLIASARRIVERHYYRSPSRYKARRNTHWLVILIVWIGIAAGLWMLYDWAAPAMKRKPAITAPKAQPHQRIAPPAHDRQPAQAPAGMG